MYPVVASDHIVATGLKLWDVKRGKLQSVVIGRVEQQRCTFYSNQRPANNLAL